MNKHQFEAIKEKEKHTGEMSKDGDKKVKKCSECGRPMGKVENETDEI